MCCPEAILQSVTASILTACVGDETRLPRTLVVVAHPDDEVLALGGRLSRHGESVFVHVTDGVPLDGCDAALHGFESLEQYRETRAEELRRAFRLAGIADATYLQLQIADQRAAMHLGHLAVSVRKLIDRVAAEAILTHPYEGGHPDHDACAFAVHTAVGSMGPARRPVIIEAAFYHAGQQGIETNRFLPGPVATTEVTRQLSAAERADKQALLDCFTTQRDTLKYFDPGIERYRIAPAYDFTQPPHEGELFYERFPWGMTGDRFRRLAALALAEPYTCA
jgi:LmbE family N-acetylglucosaminyl deacetylase